MLSATAGASATLVPHYRGQHRQGPQWPPTLKLPTCSFLLHHLSEVSTGHLSIYKPRNSYINITKACSNVWVWTSCQKEKTGMPLAVFADKILLPWNNLKRSSWFLSAGGVYQMVYSKSTTRLSYCRTVLHYQFYKAPNLLAELPQWKLRQSGDHGKKIINRNQLLGISSSWGLILVCTNKSYAQGHLKGINEIGIGDKNIGADTKSNCWYLHPHALRQALTLMSSWLFSWWMENSQI